jgi:hypothetical protein
VEEIEAVMKDKTADVKKELEAHQTFESWGREGLELARKAVYLNGELKVGVAGRDDEVPEAPAEYATGTGRAARVQIGKAGTRLADQLRKLSP